MINLKETLIFASLLFCIGIYGALTRRNTIGILISIELIFNSCCLNFVVFTRYYNPELLIGDAFVLFVISVAACEVAIGLALLLSIYRSNKNISSDQINIMKG